MKINTYMKDNEDGIERKPDEESGIHVTTHIKIFDPNTDEVFVQQRGDS